MEKTTRSISRVCRNVEQHVEEMDEYPIIAEATPRGDATKEQPQIFHISTTLRAKDQKWRSILLVRLT